ncbi:MAG: hypothetical protein HRF46_13340, partial [Acidobacteriota bacterium]
GYSSFWADGPSPSFFEAIRPAPISAPPDTYPPIHPERGGVSAVATGVAGLVGGALIGAGLMASKKLGEGPSAQKEE